MKFVAVTYGTEGDTRPMALLCRALMNAGHSAHLLAGAGTLDYPATLGVTTTALAGDIRTVLRQDTVLKHGGFRNTARAFARIAAVNSGPWLRATAAASEGCDAVIIGGLAAFVGLSAAEAVGIPAIGTGLIPITPTRDFASPFLRPGLVPRWLNRASHKLVNALIWHVFKGPVNAARADVCGLPPRRHVWTSHPMLYGISPSLVPQPADWQPTARICGHWLAPETEWSPPAALGEFLAAGEPPVYVGFGSMGALGSAQWMGEALRALRGRRALFYPGWSNGSAVVLPPNIHVLTSAPHGWLFPRVRMVIHHGGAGTAHAAARAGVPSVVVPFAGDQFFWADRLREAGVAPAPVLANGLNADQLARAIDAADRDEVCAKAAALAVSFVREDGLKTAVTAIESLVRNCV